MFVICCTTVAPALVPVSSAGGTSGQIITAVSTMFIYACMLLCQTMRTLVNRLALELRPPFARNSLLCRTLQPRPPPLVYIAPFFSRTHVLHSVVFHPYQRFRPHLAFFMVSFLVLRFPSNSCDVSWLHLCVLCALSCHVPLFSLPLALALVASGRGPSGPGDLFVPPARPEV